MGASLTRVVLLMLWMWNWAQFILVEAYSRSPFWWAQCSQCSESYWRCTSLSGLWGFWKGTFGKPQNERNRFLFPSLDGKLHLASVHTWRKTFRLCLFWVKFSFMLLKSRFDPPLWSLGFPPPREKRHFHGSSQTCPKPLFSTWKTWTELMDFFFF